jgi:D-tyrosyl-tRNA(Tyr) deacylase
MRAVVQRVRHGAVSVQDESVARIDKGFVILLGVTHGDGVEQADWLAKKCAGLRVFEDGEGKMNLSLRDIQGKALVISQFTLYGDTRKGRRPSFVDAASPEVAEPLVNAFLKAIQAEGIEAYAGRFGEHMLVEIENDGPVTIILERGQEK